MSNYERHIAETASRTGYIDERLHSGFKNIIADIPAGSSVVELACGSGTLLEALRAKGCTVAGVDLSPGAVEMSRAKGLDVVQGNCDQFDSDPAMIEILARKPDYLVFSKCLVYLTRKHEIFQAFSGKGIYVYQSNQSWWRRVLRPDINVLGYGEAVYRLADGRIIDINSMRALQYWGESFGFRSRVLPKLHWLRKNAVVVYER